MSDPAEIRGRRLRWCDTHKQPAWDYADGSVQCMHDLIVESYNEHVLGPVLLADPVPVGLTEDERRDVEGLRKMVLRGFTPHEDAFAVLLAIIDRLSAPVDDREPSVTYTSTATRRTTSVDDDRERIPEGWQVEWVPGPPAMRSVDTDDAYPVLIPVSPSVDPEEEP